MDVLILFMEQKHCTRQLSQSACFHWAVSGPFSILLRLHPARKPVPPSCLPHQRSTGRHQSVTVWWHASSQAVVFLEWPCQWPGCKSQHLKVQQGYLQNYGKIGTSVETRILISPKIQMPRHGSMFYTHQPKWINISIGRALHFTSDTNAKADCLTPRLFGIENEALTTWTGFAPRKNHIVAAIWQGVSVAAMTISRYSQVSSSCPGVSPDVVDVGFLPSIVIDLSTTYQDLASRDFCGAGPVTGWLWSTTYLQMRIMPDQKLLIEVDSVLTT